MSAVRQWQFFVVHGFVVMVTSIIVVAVDVIVVVVVVTKWRTIKIYCARVRRWWQSSVITCMSFGL